MPCDYSLYPKDWKSRIRPDILKRAGEVRNDEGEIIQQASCEQCDIENYSVGYRDKEGKFHKLEPTMQGETDGFDAQAQGFKIIKVVLTIAHLDHDITNNDYNNLKALCNRCHLRHDIEHHKKNSSKTRKRKKGLQELFQQSRLTSG